MKNDKILKRLDKGISNHAIVQLYLTFDENKAFNVLPLRRSDTMIMYVPEGDLEKNGYVVRELKDIVKVKKTETVIDSSRMKDINRDCLDHLNYTDWRLLLESIGKDGRVAIVECEHLSRKELKYAIGKIDKVGKNYVGIRYFGPDKLWEDMKWKISYDHITRVTIGSGYTKVLNKYVTDPGAAEVVDVVVDLPGQTLIDENV